MVSQILNSQSKNITSAAIILGISSLLSKLLGLVRDRLLAGSFGAGDELDAYYAAFRIPDFIFNVLAIGAISAALIPVFAKVFHKDQNEAWVLTNGVLNIFLAAIAIISIILIIFCPSLISLIAPGFEGAKKTLTVNLTRIMFLSPLFFTVSNIFSCILQYFKRFLISSLAPIVYNLGIILGIILFVPKLGVYGLAWGVVFGAFLHMAVQIPSVKLCGYHFKFVFDIYNQGVRKIIKLMIPRSIGLGAGQINLIVITAIASTLASGSLAIFNLSNNLQYIPIGIIGISFATAVFPSLSREFIREQKEEFVRKLSSVFRQVLFLVIPASALIFILRAQIVRIVLGTGQFSWTDTRLTAASLGIFSFGIFAQALIPLISKAFYALHNTITPVKISIFSILLNIGLSFLFVWLLSFYNPFYDFILENLKLEGINNIAVLGLPLAFSISGIFNLFYLLAALYKRIGNFDLKTIFKYFLKVLVATLLMSGITYFSLYFLANFVNMQTFLGVFLQAGGAFVIAILFYMIIARFFGLYKIEEIRAIFS